MQKGLVGVIVPVYKVEKYITECIESILAQTYTHFRLILVDDGTPDNAGKICDEYAKKDSRITVIHQENAGVTRARARGVKEATDCEWVTFVDSDDTMTTDALSTMLAFTKDDVDIVVATINKDESPTKDYVTNIEYRHWAVKNIYYIGAPWSKLIRRTLLSDFVFDIPSWINIHEDTIMNIRIAFNVKKNIAICKMNIYNYRFNENGAVQTIKKDISYEGFLYKYIKDSIPIEQLEIYIEDAIAERLSIWRNFYKYKYNVDGMTKEKLYIELKNDIIQYKFKLGFVEKIIFYSTNPIIRFIVINIKKGENIMKNKFNSALICIKNFVCKY